MTSLLFKTIAARRLFVPALVVASFLLAPAIAQSQSPPTVHDTGTCELTLHDYELSPTSQSSINFVVSDLLKNLQRTFNFTTRTNLRVRIRVFGRFEDFRDYASTNRGPQDGEYAGVVISNLAGYYSLRSGEVVTWAQRDRSFFGNSLLHECSHAIMHEQFRHVPIWLDEGCAVHFAFPKYMRDPADQKMLITHWLTMRKYLNEKSLPDLREFLDIGEREFRSMTSERSYPVSWSLMELFMTTPPRRKAMSQMLDSLQKPEGRRAGCAALLDRFYPGGLTAMEKDWHSMIARGASGMQGWRLVEPKK